MLANAAAAVILMCSVAILDTFSFVQLGGALLTKWSILNHQMVIIQHLMTLTG